MRWSRQDGVLTPLVAALVVLSGAGTALAAPGADRSECLRSRADELAALAACGHSGSIRYCLSQLPAQNHLCTADVLHKCFVGAGCTPDEARIEAAWTLRRCDEQAGSDDLGDLRRRQNRPPAGDDDNAATTNRGAGGGGRTTPAAPGRTTAPARQQPTTQAPQTAPATQEVEVVTVIESTSGATPGAVTSTFSSTSTPLVCFTTTTISTTTCPIQSTGPRSGKETLACFSTQVSFPTCAAGLLCKADSQGNPVCMKIDNTFSTAGIIISLFFAVATTIAVAAICFFCCRESRAQKKLVKAAEAAALARSAAIDKKRPSVGVRSVSAQSGVSDQQPLIHPGQSVVYSDHQDPFADQHRMR